MVRGGKEDGGCPRGNWWGNLFSSTSLSPILSFTRASDFCQPTSFIHSPAFPIFNSRLDTHTRAHTHVFLKDTTAVLGETAADYRQGRETVVCVCGEGECVGVSVCICVRNQCYILQLFFL